jgi:hypothetical protein
MGAGPASLPLSPGGAGHGPAPAETDAVADYRGRSRWRPGNRAHVPNQLVVGPGVSPSALHDYHTRAGAGRRSDAEDFEKAILDLARVIVYTAVQAEMRNEYAPVIRYLAHAHRALREIYGKDTGTELEPSALPTAVTG